ncbi:uncharacterized protein [Prorops nasuta]|uniref:uncharacterized protein isoform X2 n=1 Tax=Prorops nasuta TaxID=863751 RepID=UPI0034CD2B2F
MDAFTINLLTEWNLEDLISSFKENEINEQNIKHLNDSMLKELIPKIGRRILFINKLKQLYSNESLSQNKTSSIENLSSDDEVSNDENALPSANNSLISTRLYNDRRTIHKTLKKSTRGSAVLCTYKKNKVLSMKNRNIIVDIIMEDVLQKEKRLRNADFHGLAKQICEEFPTENLNTYYVPPITKKESNINKSISSKGKLVSKYRNNLYGLKLLNAVGTTEEESDTDENVDIDTEGLELKQWLSVTITPWDKVKENWKKSFNFRRQEYKKNKDFNIATIVAEWPILRQPNAFALINEDFDSLRLTTVNLNEEIWETFFQKVLKLRDLNNRDSNSLALKEVVTLEEINIDLKVAGQLLLLPYLLPPKGRIKCGQKHWKPSVTECKDSILMHLLIPGDIIVKVDERRELMKKLNLSVQPFIIIIGPTLTDIESIYVCLDDIIYKLESVLQAVDICFKIFHVFNLKYPPESEHIWQLVQLYIYNIKTVYDKYISQVAELITDMNKVRQQCKLKFKIHYINYTFLQFKSHKSLSLYKNNH